MQAPGRFTQFCPDRIAAMMEPDPMARPNEVREEYTMRLVIEIAAAVLLVICISATSAAFAADGKAVKTGVQADGLSCAFSVAKSASPAARCAAIRRQCGGKIFPHACGGQMLAAGGGPPI